jgi:hypothetical protein
MNESWGESENQRRRTSPRLFSVLPNGRIFPLQTVSLIVSLLPSNDLHRSANNSLGRNASVISSVSSIRSLVVTLASTAAIDATSA